MYKLRRYFLQLKLTFMTLKIFLTFKYFQMRYHQVARQVSIDIELVNQTKRRAEKRLVKLERIGAILHGEGWLEKNHVHLTIVPNEEK